MYLCFCYWTSKVLVTCIPIPFSQSALSPIAKPISSSLTLLALAVMGLCTLPNSIVLSPSVVSSCRAYDRLGCGVLLDPLGCVRR